MVGEPPTAIPTGLPSTAPAVAPAEILPTPLAVVAQRERRLATAEIHFAEGLVSLGESIWVKTDDGLLVEYDPASDQQVREKKLDTTSDPATYCQGIGVAAGYIWACSATDAGTDIVRIDPETLEIVATVPARKIHEQLRLPFLADRVWVLSGDGNQLVGIDTSSNEAGQPIDLGKRCFQLAATGSAIVATCTLDDTVLLLDPATGQIIAQATLNEPRLVAADDQAVWVGFAQGVAWLDARDLTQVATFKGMSPGTGGDLYTTGDEVWVRKSGSSDLYHIDPATKTIVEAISGESDDAGGGLLVTADSVWLSTNDPGSLIRLSRDK
jgi:glutamine cyclotransferase